MKRFLLLLIIAVAVVIVIYFIDKYLVEVHTVVLVSATVAATNIANLVFDAKQKKDVEKLK